MALLRAIGFGAALGLTAATPLPAQTVVDLYGVETATLEWTPASGAVAGYYVIVSRNGGDPSFYGISSDNREAVTSSLGDVVTVQVAAFDGAGLAGPMSPPSSALRFNPLPTPSDGGGDSPPADPGEPSGSDGGTTTPDGPGGTPGETPIGGFVRSDYSGDGRSDLLVRDPASGALELWTLQETQVVRRAALPHLPYPWYLESGGDFDGDGTADLIWRNKDSGKLSLWLVREGAVVAGGALDVPGVKISRSWKVSGSGDFDGDGRDDIVLAHPIKGFVEILLMDGAQVVSRVSRSAPTPEWRVAATADTDGDRRAEIVWAHQKTRAVALEWLDAPRQSVPLDGALPGWRLLGSADVDGDGRDDLWMRNADTRQVQPWLLDGAHATPMAWSTKAGDKYWEFRGLGDFDGDGLSDPFWQHPDGFVEIWFGAPAGVEPAFVSEQTAGAIVVGDEGD